MKPRGVVNQLGYELCGMELEVSNETMTTERKPRVYPRNTKELPVSVAIEKLRQNAVEEAIAIRKVQYEYVRRANHILLRVPEVVRDHVANEGSRLPESNDHPAPTAVVEGVGAEPTSWLNEPVQPAERVEVDRESGKAKRVGAQRT